MLAPLSSLSTFKKPRGTFSTGSIKLSRQTDGFVADNVGLSWNHSARRNRGRFRDRFGQSASASLPEPQSAVQSANETSLASSAKPSPSAVSFAAMAASSFCFSNSSADLTFSMRAFTARQISPIGFIGFVCSFAVFTQPDEPLHDSLFAQHVPLFHHLGGGQGCRQRVVVGCRDRIELVVMATGTAKRLAEHRRPMVSICSSATSSRCF